MTVQSEKPFYWIIDHRAPRYVPRGTPHTVDMAIVPITVLSACAASVLTGLAIGLLNPFVGIAALVTVWWFLHWRRLIARLVVKLPKDGSLRDFDMRDELLGMQRTFAAHPDLQPVIEPVLVASYDLARHANLRAIRERHEAVRALVRDAAGPDPEVDNADLEELRNIVQIRRQMRSEGLL